MTEPSFQLEFLWLPSHEELPDVNKLFELKQSGTEFKPTGPLLNLKKHLSNFCDSPMFIKDFVPNTELTKEDTNNKSLCKFQKENAMFHQEYLYNIYCRIQIERDINTDYSRLVKLFSSFRKGCILGSELWLKHELMYMIDSSIETVDKYFILDKFELGNFVGLMNFVTHFDSGSTLQQHGFKVTQIKVKFLHDYKRLELYFVVGESHLKVKKRSAKSHRLYKLTIHYNAIHSVIVSRRDGFVAYFRMLQAPLMYAVEQDEEDESYISYQDLHSGTGWFRAVDLFKRCPSNMKKEFSMNTVLGLNFATENYDLLVQLVNHNKNMKVYFAPVNVVSSENSVPLFHINNFECFYAFQCLLSRSFEAADQLILRKEIDQFKSFVLEKSEENSEALSEALYQLYYSFNKGNVVILMHSLPILYDKFVNQIPLVTTQNKGNLINSENQQNNLLLIKRAICMPTHVMFLPPQPTLKSRALRSCNPDFSLRISIRDTNLETINMTLAHGLVANKKVQLREFFKEHFKTPLLKGIKVGKRCYNYVGSSTSQLRAHGLWFYACDNEGRTADKIRKEFGDIDKIKQVPKFMARMGQTFSQAMVNVTVPQEYTNVDCPEDDVKGGIVKYLTDNLDIEEDRPEKFLVELSVNEREESKEEVEQYTFSDGVGRISLEIAEEVYKKLDIEDKKPSAMQIRYAGCKGMLVIDPRLEGKKIFFRESMKKFSSKNDSLEILKLSEKRTAYLNRPLITILEQLGIEKEVFLKLQKKMIQNHIKSMFHETEAWCFLHRNSLLRLDFLKLHISGIRFTEDPLFRSMIYALFRKQIELLKTKANIEIPVDQGRVMFGVMDETFTLEYGQVFVQYSDWDTDEPRILEGTVVVTKNPCMHPGDVRKFEAVDVEALHHIRDCIVFPAKGHRPHPDEMAGSDLDGDEYHVMWLKDLIFPSDNKEPMHYAVRKDKTQDRKTPITCPQTSEEWIEIGEGFLMRWNFPHCYGAIDGKHVVIKAPPRSGSIYHNYKGSFSIILLAVVDHDYRFRYIDVGANGRCSDAGVFSNSAMKKALETNALNLPEDGFLVGDDAFPLTKYLIKPYSRRQLSKEQKIFNYRLSRARRIVENAFGIMAQRFQIYFKPIPLSPEKVDGIVKATCALHNFLRTTGKSTYMPPGSYDEEDFNSFNFTPGSWRNIPQPMGFLPISASFTPGHNPSKEATRKRDALCLYVNGEGALPWQHAM